MKFKLPFFIENKLLDKLCTVKVVAEISRHDVDGKLLHTHKQICHSLNANFLEAIYISMIENLVQPQFGFSAPFTSSIKMLDLTNNYQTVSSTNLLTAKGDTASDATGIVVGTGVPVVNPITPALTAKISTGSGAGQLSYLQQSSAAGVTVLGNVSSLIMTRTWMNNSGGAILVKEFGVQCGAGNRYLMLIDPVNPNQNVNSLQTLSISLTYSITT
ncbi:MAG: hypothetical protein M0P71_16255 [Melioribacteraceae bacterium]|jgi:hypothetical protein|nr:hypothetical protein [Melioribacteraceae bacterium]